MWQRGAFERNCPEKNNNKKKNQHKEEAGSAIVASDGYESCELLYVADD